jgi:hypothetical protein
MWDKFLFKFLKRIKFFHFFLIINFFFQIQKIGFYKSLERSEIFDG